MAGLDLRRIGGNHCATWTSMDEEPSASAIAATVIQINGRTDTISTRFLYSFWPENTIRYSAPNTSIRLRWHRFRTREWLLYRADTNYRMRCHRKRRDLS